MKRIEIVGIGKKSVFKTTIYLMIVPLSILFVIGFIMTIVSIVSTQPDMLIIGIPYMIMPVFMLIIYGLLSMLVALVYNKLASRFGGLELNIKEKGNELELTKEPVG